MKYKLSLFLCPSINNYWIQRRGSMYRIKSPEAQEWLEVATIEIMNFCRKNNVKPVEKFKAVYFTWYLPNRNCDSHNYLKGTLDAMEHGGIFLDDKFILNRTKKVFYDKQNPRVEIEL